MNVATIQSELKAVLETVTELSGLVIMLELDQDATAAELAAQDAVFEKEISRKGFVLIVSTPRADGIDRAKLPGAVHLRTLCQVAFIENPTINRGTVDAELPDVTPANKKPLVLIRAAIAKLLTAGFEFPDQPITVPEQDLEGLNLHGLLVTGKDLIRAT